MNMETARKLVTADVRESYPEVTEAEAVEHVHQTLALTSTGPGWMQLVDYGDELTEAYSLVLADTTRMRSVRSRVVALERCVGTMSDMVDEFKRELDDERTELTAQMKARHRNALELS